MNGDDVPYLINGVIILMLVASSLTLRRASMGQMTKYAVAWLFIFAIVAVLFSFRDEAEMAWSRVQTSFSPETPRVSGGEVRINRGDDGHFSVEAMVNGKPVVLLVDTGATVSTMSRNQAQSAGVAISDSGFGVIVETANGTTTMRRARARTIAIGPIVREDQALWISEDDDLNVLGMNFLSSLTSWRVEGRTMVLTP